MAWDVACLGANIGERDSKALAAPHVAFGAADWRVFVRRVKRGEYDLN
ncbi:DUF397 domain-containing protein [Actinomadura sp. 6K520]|jgi:hypothetical protein|nr:DUF397 domain-containing protein [Actinomadura sp. 6K520]